MLRLARRCVACCSRRRSTFRFGRRVAIALDGERASRSSSPKLTPHSGFPQTASVSTASTRITIDDVVARAVRRAELDDLGPPTWREGLEILLGELNGDDRISDPGYEAVIGRFVDALWNRLRVIDYARRHPEVRSGGIREPLVILGMPRTGTTVASYLLDQDPAHRSLLNWEAPDS